MFRFSEGSVMLRRTSFELESVKLDPLKVELLENKYNPIFKFKYTIIVVVLA